MMLLVMELEQEFEGETFEIDVRLEEKDQLDHLAHYPLKSGPQTYKSINIFEVKASTSGKKVVHFWKARKKNNSKLDVQEETRFDCQPDELERLIALLDELEEIADLDRGEHIFLKKDAPSAQAALAAIDSVKTAGSENVEELAAKLIESVGEVEKVVDDFDAFAEHVSDEILEVENLIGYVRTRKVVDRFETLVVAEKSERKYQQFLEEYPWLFGNRYVRDSGNRQLTRDEEVDFCLESVNGYYTLFEIKRPDHDVVIKDRSHDTYYASSELSKAIAQTENYIKEIETNYNNILRLDDMNILKPKGTIVIGSNLDGEKREGLRILNSHLNQIRIVTYTEIVSMGKRLIKTYDKNSEIDESRMITDI
jgi:hypothetical protein